ncbi:PorP/SprF family type IX secretion system membrane protein [Algoriphagus sediminis]|uniref:Type IX secretion system membrane protein PorP/SprF n=1 Tax=Algoriphagus sediminis TaxID=3057113 RepID=A0ABT7YE59_9BACT|nr:type IX secretion system membrane protein PorP/SprF [Algoriphagus sediminis]MDN3204817.1 type IX secretion system membrane protein PorP/SprF [Algoriphagus sediminis]
MKRVVKPIMLIGVLTLFIQASLEAQTRKYISQFSHFQSYYNPSLTGYEGSAVRAFVRNQWSGVDGAPRTYFISGELDFGELGGNEDPALMGKNAISINYRQDNYGAFRESEVMLGYASRIRLTEKHNLRLGVGVNYQSVRLDGNELSAEDMNDPTISQYAGSFSDMQIIDFNLGIALTHAKYYFSYGMQRVNGGKIMSGDEFMDGYPASSVFQAGYREALGPNMAVIFNAFYRTQKDLEDNFEMNLKALLMDRIWVGVGTRVNYATNLQLGVMTKRIRLGYVYEFPVAGSYLLPGNTHEFTAIFSLFRDNVRRTDNEVLIW